MHSIYDRARKFKQQLDITFSAYLLLRICIYSLSTFDTERMYKMDDFRIIVKKLSVIFQHI